MVDLLPSLRLGLIMGLALSIGTDFLAFAAEVLIKYGVENAIDTSDVTLKPTSTCHLTLMN